MKTLCSHTRVSACGTLLHAHIRQNPWLCQPLLHPGCTPAGCQQQHTRRARCQHTSSVQEPAEQQQQHQPAKQHPRFYAAQLPSSVGAAVELEPEEARHAVRVLRLKQGDPIELCDGKGGLVLCEVAHTDKNAATVVATSAPQAVSWQGPKWVVAAACLTLKGGRTDWLIEKATELGAYAVLPLITERSQTGATKAKFKSLSSRISRDRKDSQAAAGAEDFQPSRLERLALAATKQSLRVHALQLLPATSLAELLPALQRSPVSLVATAGAPPVLQALQEAAQHSMQQQQQQQDSTSGASSWHGQPCYLLVGPEGDFTPEEVQALAAAGVVPVGLGSNRLRTETAAIALLSAAALFADAATGKQRSSRASGA